MRLLSLLLLITAESYATQVKLGSTTILGTALSGTGLERFAGIINAKSERKKEANACAGR